MAGETTLLQGMIDRMQAGDERARDELITCASERLRGMVRKELRQYARLQRWEDIDDVVQNASLRLWQALKGVTPQSVRHFLNLAGMHIRLELLDLVRHYYGPQGLAAHYKSSPPVAQTPAPGLYDRGDTTLDPARLAQFTELHETIRRLPDDERELFHLLFYQELSQAEAAQVLGTTERTVRRRWQLARLKLRELLKGELPV